MLNRLAGGMKNMRPAMADIAQVLAGESERQFATESGPLGPWPGLAKSTEETRAAKGS